MTVNTVVALGIPDLMKALSDAVTAFFQDDMHKHMERHDADQIYVSAMSHMFNMALLQCVPPEERLNVFDQMRASFFEGNPVEVPEEPEASEIN